MSAIRARLTHAPTRADLEEALQEAEDDPCPVVNDQPPIARGLPRNVIRVLGVLCLGTSMTACGDGGEAEPGFSTEIDTLAGVVRIQHRGSAPSWRLEPLISLGVMGAPSGAPSPEEFGRVESVIADAAGDLFVADGMALEIRVFDPEGRFIRTIGRKGGGPGEMEGLHGIAWLAGDTIVVMDFGNARLMLLGADGQHVGQWRWLRLTGSVRFLFNGGPREFYAQTFRTTPTGGDLATRPTWVRYTPRGPLDSLDIPEADPRPGTGVVCRGNGIGFFGNPHGDRFMTVPVAAGERVVAWSSEYRLAFLDPAGDTVRVVSRTSEPLPMPDSVWAPVEEDYREFQGRWRGADCEGSIARPAHRPVLRDIFLDHDGRILVEHSTPEGVAFDLLFSDGRWLATFPSPSNRDTSVPPFLRDDRLYLVTKDSLDIQQVRVFRLDPGA